MPLSTKPYKGARDFYPNEKRLQKYLFSELRSIVEKYGYEEYDAPILEPLDLYLAKSGEEIINEQTYQFVDRGGRDVVIRPEMTPTVARMIAGKRQELPLPIRWYSIPNLWRYERPQKGRLREHWQLNVDLFGVSTLDAEIEILDVANAILINSGATSDMFSIRINSRKLVDFLLSDYVGLSKEQILPIIKIIDRIHKISSTELIKNIDEVLHGEDNLKKVEKLLALLEVDSLDKLPKSAHDHPSTILLKELIDRLHRKGIINAVFDMSLMRGFDYYTDIVFEIVDTDSSNNRSMFGGGRYDGLVGLFGVEAIPTIGFGMGDVTFYNFLECHKLLPNIRTNIDVFVILIDGFVGGADESIDRLRKSGLNVATDYSKRKIDKQIKAAVKHGIKYVVFIGENEIKNNSYVIKNLEEEIEISGTIADINAFIQDQTS
ncbi:MAG: histidine--tRNA ligase [Candidatus Saccharimonadales bacterium]